MVVLNVYKTWLRDFSTSGSSSTAMNYVAFGTDSTTPLATDTSLGSEISPGGRLSADSCTGIEMGVWEVIVTIQDTDTNFDDEVIREFGVVNTSSGGSFANRQTQIAVTCDAARTWDLKYIITFKLGV